MTQWNQPNVAANPKPTLLQNRRRPPCQKLSKLGCMEDPGYIYQQSTCWAQTQDCPSISGAFYRNYPVVYRPSYHLQWYFPTNNERVNILQQTSKIWKISKFNSNLKVTFLKKEVMKASPALFWKTFFLSSKISLAGKPYDAWLRKFKVRSIQIPRTRWSSGIATRSSTSLSGFPLRSGIWRMFWKFLLLLSMEPSWIHNYNFNRFYWLIWFPVYLMPLQQRS